MRGAGCLVLLAILGLGCGELWVFLLIRERVDDWVIPLLGIIMMSIAGFRIISFNIKRLPMEFLSGGAGRRLIGVIAGALLLFPGFITGALALPLLLPPVQRGLGRLGNVLAGGLMRHFMVKMGSSGKAGGFAGFPGGFPGGPFPGMQPRGKLPLRPDDSVRQRPKIIETTVERDEPRS